MNLTIRKNLIQEYGHPEQQLKALCRTNPQLAAYQQEIDFYLCHAGSAENRMAVLRFLVESRLTELHRHLAELTNLIGRTCK
ncbi:MAG: hypothetical protein R2941_23940 [Desulfobacterales bacterium]